MTTPNKDLCGYKAKVVGYTDRKIKVRTTQKIKKIKEEKLDKIVNTDEVFL